MTFTSFFERPIGQMLAEAVENRKTNRYHEQNRYNKTSRPHFNPINSTTPNKTISVVSSSQIEPTFTTLAASDIDHTLNQIKTVLQASNATIKSAPKITRPGVARLDPGLERLKAADSSPIPTASFKTTPNVSDAAKPRETSIDPASERLEPIHHSSVPTAPPPEDIPAVAAVVESKETTPSNATSIGPDKQIDTVVTTPVKVISSAYVTSGVYEGLDQLEAVHSAPSVTVTVTVTPAEPVSVIATAPVKNCKYFLSRRGCRFSKKCSFFHDQVALTRNREQWAADDAKKKLEKVRCKQQLTYTKEALAVKSNSTTTKPTVAAAITVSPSKPLPKKSAKKRPTCRDWRSFSGCHRKNCPYPHELILPKNQENFIEDTTPSKAQPPTCPKAPSKEPEKLIDDTVPGEFQVPISPKIISQQPRKSGQPFNRILPEEYYLEHVVWEGNPYLDYLPFCHKAIWKIFGRPPTRKQAIDWIQEMHSNDNFKHFNNHELIKWAKVIGIGNEDEFHTHIGYLPGILKRFNPTVRLHIKKLREAYEAEEKRYKYDTFHCFSNLPNELCLKIWGFAVRSGRMLAVGINNRPITEDGHNGIFRRQSPPSPLWYVNKQSQQASMNDKECGYYFGCDYFSPRYDTLFLHEDAANLHLFAGDIARWRGGVVQRLAFPYYQLYNAIDRITFAEDLFKAFSGLIRIEFWLSDGKDHAKYLENSARVIERATQSIAKAYKYRVGKKPPRVRLIMVPEQRAKELAIGGGLW